MEVLLTNPGITLARLDLHTGQVSTQVSDRQMNDFYFSPKGKYLLYISAFVNPNPSNILHIIRLLDWQKTDIELPKGMYGAIAWSPDNNQLIAQSCDYDYPDIANCNHYSLILVDIKTKKNQIIFPDLQRTLNLESISRLSIEWFSSDQIKVVMVPSEPDFRREWLLNIKTGEA